MQREKRLSYRVLKQRLWVDPVNALCPIPVKGLTEAVEVFALVGAAALRQRFQARAAQGLTRFAGCGSVHNVCRAMSKTSRGELPIGNAQHHRGHITSIQIVIERLFFGARPQFTARPAFKLAHALPRQPQLTPNRRQTFGRPIKAKPRPQNTGLPRL